MMAISSPCLTAHASASERIVLLNGPVTAVTVTIATRRGAGRWSVSESAAISPSVAVTTM